MLVEERADVGDDVRAARRIVAARRNGKSFADGVGAIKSVVEASPTGVRGVQRITCVIHRHHELRTGDVRDFGVDIRGLHLKGRAFSESDSRFP